MSVSDRLLETVIALERALHQQAVRLDRRRVDALLHPAFVEFGRSGRRWERAAMLELLGESTSPAAEIHAEAFQAERLAAEVVLLTYRSAHRRPDGRLEQHALRSSVWVRTPTGWRLRLHQGTPTDPFEPAD